MHVPGPVCFPKPKGEQTIFSFAFPKLVLCVCPWPRTFTWSSQIRHETMEAEQIPIVSVDYGFFKQPEDRAHDTSVLNVRDRKSKGIWSHPVPSKGVMHPYRARAPVHAAQESLSQVRSRSPALLPCCDAVKKGWHGEDCEAIIS